MDDFDLNDYMESVHFNDIKLPPSVPIMPTRKEYLGIKKFMDSELDFMKATVLSKSMEDCILYSDMPLKEMAADPDFPKKYMYGMALMLKKGLHIHQIHDVNRPFPEMMLGLESWIPLYMTGQISPYYLPVSQSQVFCHFLKVSGAAALEGTAITGNQASGRYVLYRSHEDVKHYRTRAEQLLAKASPLMDIYQAEHANEYRKTQRLAFENNDCKMICSNLPIPFLSKELLEGILNRAQVNPKTRSEIMEFHKVASEKIPGILKEHKLTVVLPPLSAPSESGKDDSSIKLSLADSFLDEEIALTPEEHARGLAEIESLCSTYPNFSMELEPSPAFHNINILIAGDKLVIVSKEKSPTIHFVIHHKKMIRAFQNFIPPLYD